MSNPTFNGVALVSRAGRTQLGCRQTRAVTETMPGVDGLFVVPLGSGGRTIEVTGLLTATSTMSDWARRDVLSAYRTREALANGRTLAAFVDADGTSYPNCLLVACAHGPCRIVRQGANNYAAWLPVTMRLVQLTP